MSNRAKNNANAVKWQIKFGKSYRVIQPVLAGIVILLPIFSSDGFIPSKVNLFFILCVVLLVTMNLIHIFWIDPKISELISKLSKEKSNNLLKTKKLTTELKEEKYKTHLVIDNIREVFDGCLYRFSKKLEFGKNKNNDERITIFIHDGDKHFIAFGRYSANPRYSVPGRTQYPDDQGCIAQGWNNGWHFARFSQSKYLARNQSAYKMDKATVSKITMKSMLYGVQCITDRKGEPLAVLVVESISPRRYNETRLKDTLNQGEELSHLAELIEKFRHHIPNVRHAAKRGF